MKTGRAVGVPTAVTASATIAFGNSSSSGYLSSPEVKYSGYLKPKEDEFLKATS
jgi:hypothetical protein